MDLVSELARELGDAVVEQVDDLFSGLDLPSAEELACWRTLLPAIADLVASVGDRFQTGGDILDRLPDWIPPEPAALIRERRAQALLARLFARDIDAELAALPSDTVLCRCEGRTLADLRAFGPQPTARELRLTGRFGMGACQGRFCADWVARISGQPDLGRARLPVQPLSIADLMALAPPETGDLP